MLYQVEIRSTHGNALSGRMESMRLWLDQRRIEPASFRYAFTGRGIVYRVDFPIESEAVAFAAEFDGKMLSQGTRMAL
jgi:hypothetical protein